MEIASFFEEINYGSEKPLLKVLLDTPYTKEVRIAFKKSQELAEHKAKFPIVIQILEGKIDFGVASKKRYALVKGDMITLEAHVMHDLIAMEDSLIRLSFHKS